jgi:hypothetical protein
VADYFMPVWRPASLASQRQAFSQIGIPQIGIPQTGIPQTGIPQIGILKQAFPIIRTPGLTKKALWKNGPTVGD